jgi:hypothetical protein
MNRPKHTNTLRAAAYSLGVSVDLLADILPHLRNATEEMAKFPELPMNLYHPPIWVWGKENPNIVPNPND